MEEDLFMIRIIFIKQRKTLICCTILFFFLLSIFVFSITYFLHYQLNENKKKELFKSEQQLIDVENAIISKEMNQIISDLLYVYDCYQLNDIQNGSDAEMLEQWLAFSNRRKIYDQIRFLDLEGNEVYRVEYQETGAILVEKTELQNKKESYYFADTIILDQNQVYISKFDLNIENDKVVEPLKPMIRIAMPYFDKRGICKGMIILNYSADDMLNQVKKVSSTSNGDIFLLNTEGYWIYDSSNSSNEWSFMFEDKKNISFRNDYPEVWEQIQKNENGYVINTQGIFIYTSIITSKAFENNNDDYRFVLGGGDWVLVSYISGETVNGNLFTESNGLMVLGLLRQYFVLYILLFFIALIIAILISINKNEKERIKYFSETDVMTGVYNRRTGFEKLTFLYKNMSKNNSLISICFIDINGLKEVNDMLGHVAGDELIISVIEGIKKSIRTNDFVARLGGDEFLIVFEGLGEEKSEEIWKRIILEYNYVNEKEKREYLISVSHGIETFKFDSDEYMDIILNQADEKMYREKNQIKKELKVLRIQQKTSL